MSVKYLLKRIYNDLMNFRNWFRLVWKNKTDYKVSLLTKTKYALKGFTVNEYIWYDLEHNDYREYISDYERIRSREINSEYKIILDSKLLFDEVFRKYTRVPKIYAWISGGIVYGLHGEDIENTSLIKTLKKYVIAVLKLENGYEGKGTYVIEYKQNNKENVFLVNGSLMSDVDVERLCLSNGNAILSEYMFQSEFENSLYPDAANTIRIVCAKKKGKEKTHIIKAVQRIGNDACKPVDNVSAGGYASEIDLETGELGPAIAKCGPMERRMIEFDVHPDTGAQITGKVIPNWKTLKTEIIDLTNRFPYLNFVAWDVLLTEDGFCIIEGNASSGCGMFQMKHGVRNSELGDIYRSYGIIK